VATISIPEGLTTKGFGTNSYIPCGTIFRDITSINTRKIIQVSLADSDNHVLFQNNDYSNTGSPFGSPLEGVSILATGEFSYVQFSVPISQWVSNVNLASDFTEYAYNTSTSTSTDTTNFGYGPEGALIQDFAQSGIDSISKHGRFTRPLTGRDIVILEVDNGTGRWQDVAGRVPISWNDAGTTVYGANFQLTGAYDFVVNFHSKANSHQPWADYTVYRWRVRKVSNGNMAEVPTQIYINKSTTPVLADTGAGIIESGGDDIDGRYIKYGDGTMMCYGSSSITCSSGYANGFGSTSGSTYYGTGTITFPASFHTAPNISMAQTSNVAYATASAGNKTVSGFNSVAFSSTSGYSVSFDWQAIGRWKA